ncbi:MAG: hypothetical protein Q8M02_10715 [Candidatus Didemnitutus sp.]|nr:hypothetical protein [Candidatus Didemnitutus sp.]
MSKFNQAAITTMNTNFLVQTFGYASLFSVVFFGFSTVNIDLPLVGTVIAYLAALGIVGIAVFDGSKRSS